jgi:hypothetical protein
VYPVLFVIALVHPAWWQPASSREVGRAGTSSIGIAGLFSMVESLKDGASSRVRGAEYLDTDVYEFKGSKEKNTFCIVCSVKIKIIKLLNL